MARDSDTNIAVLPGTKVPAEVFCGWIMEHARNGKIKHIACVIQWDDDSTGVYHTEMRAIDRAWLRCIFEKDFVLFPEIEYAEPNIP